MSLTLIKRNGSPYYYIRGIIEGKAIFISTKCEKKSDAERFRTLFKLDVKQAIDDSYKKKLHHAIDAYILKGGEDRFLYKIRKHIGNFNIDEIKQELVDKSAREIYPSAKESTIVRQFYNPLSSVMNYAVQMSWIAGWKIKKPKVKITPPQWAELDWLELLWEHSTPKLKALTTFLPYTGCRIGEALNLTWDNVNLKDGWAYIPDTKNGTPRTVRLPDVVVRELELIKSEGFVFKYADRSVVRNEIKRTVSKINKLRTDNNLPPIPYLSTHKIGSHTYATWMRRYTGMDSRGLVATGRWKSPQSTYRYTHTNATEESKRADLLPTSDKG